jgi:hypothetical protein
MKINVFMGDIMPLKIRFFGRLADNLGAKTIEIDKRNITAKQLLEVLKEALGDKSRYLFDDHGNLRAGVLVVVDGQPLSMIGGENAKIEGYEDIYFDTIDIYEVEGGG